MDVDGKARSSGDANALPETIGRFRVRELAGAGGNALIYAAWDEEQERPVAIKLLRGDRSVRPDQRARFLREAKAMARLDHPNVVRIYELGTHDGRVFLALEFVEGRSLREWVEQDEPEPEAIIRAYLDAGRGLAAAHHANLMHRDFKPDNVLLGDDGRVRVVDFGLARSTRGTDNFQTVENQVTGLRDAIEEGPELLQTIGLSGTPAYMALEQHFGRRVDARADQFAFCVSLWEALYGRRPFGGKTAGQISRAIEEGRIEGADDRRAPKAVRKALERGLAAERVDRWPSMDELLDALEAGNSQRGLLARLFGL